MKQDPLKFLATYEVDPTDVEGFAGAMQQMRALWKQLGKNHFAGHGFKLGGSTFRRFWHGHHHVIELQGSKYGGCFVVNLGALPEFLMDIDDLGNVVPGRIGTPTRLREYHCFLRTRIGSRGLRDDGDWIRIPEDQAEQEQICHLLCEAVVTEGVLWLETVSNLSAIFQALLRGTIARFVGPTTPSRPCQALLEPIRRYAKAVGVPESDPRLTDFLKRCGSI